MSRGAAVGEDTARAGEAATDGGGATAALQEQRDYLLSALHDLEAAHADGRVDDDEYRTLEQDLTGRAAAVIHRLDGDDGPAGDSPESRSSGGRRWIVAGGVVLAAVVAFGAVWWGADTRDPGDTLTGDIAESTPTLLAQGEACLSGGDLDCAREAYDAALDIDPTNVEAITYQGAVLFQEGDAEAALAQFDEAIALDPTFLDAWGFRIVVLDGEGRTDEAMEGVEVLVEDGNGDIALGVAGLIGSGDQVVLALQVYDAILDVEPDNAVALTYRGWMVGLAGLDDEALEYLDRAVDVDPALPDALAFRAIVLNRLGRIEEAAVALAAFDAADPPPGMSQLIDASGLRDELESAGSEADSP